MIFYHRNFKGNYCIKSKQNFYMLSYSLNVLKSPFIPRPNSTRERKSEKSSFNKFLKVLISLFLSQSSQPFCFDENRATHNQDKKWNF